MKSIGKRMDEFVDYHIRGDGECNNVVLKEWANVHCRTLQDKYELAYFFSITYCVESAIILFENRSEIFLNINSWASANKQNLVFQSDRKYIRMKDSFERCLKSFEAIRSAEDFLAKVTENGIIVLSKAIPYVSSWEMFGRFSAFLILETFVELTGIPVENYTIDWKQGNTATSGLLNVFGFDSVANYFDKTGRLLASVDMMDKMLRDLLKHVAAKGGNTNITEVETSLCAYRKFYKGSRYNGYYLDRMLEEIIFLSAKYPDISRELLEIRRRCFDKKYLGELSGWRGIRKTMKKYDLSTGEIN